MADSEKTAARSVGDFEKKEMGVGESGLPSAAASVHEKTTEGKEPEVNEKHNSKASNNDEEDDFEYPTKWKLAIITLALCLSVFCMALVGPIVTSSLLIDKADHRRITQSSQQLFLASQISSRHSTMWAGTVQLTCSQPARHNSFTANSTPTTRSNGSTSAPCSFSKLAL
jgi:hypothetical protein